MLAIDIGELHSRLREAGYVPVGLPSAPEEVHALAAIAPEIDAVISDAIRGLPEEFYDRATKLRLVAVIGAGFDAFDGRALRRRGIPLVNAGAVNAEDVAELAIGLLIAARRGIASADALVRAGAWRITESVRHRLSGSRLGIVGLGSIGSAIATRAEAFGIEIAWSGPNPKAVEWRYEPAAIELARWADSIVISCRPTPRNRHLVGERFLDALGSNGLLVNVARGSLVDETALIAALKQSRIAGAALDVFSREPIDINIWRDVPNVVFHPHSGGATHEALSDGCKIALENLRIVFEGGQLLNILN